MENLKGRIIAGNHVSNIDPACLGAIIPFEIYFFAKAELFKGKFFKWLFNQLNCIPVRRGQMDLSAIKSSIRVLNAGSPLLIFPQGTRGGKRAKAGIGMIASAVKKDIVPVYVENTTDLMKCFLRKKKVRIIIGQTIAWDSYANLDDNKDKYQLIADDIYNKIIKLGHEQN